MINARMNRLAFLDRHVIVCIGLVLLFIYKNLNKQLDCQSFSFFFFFFFFFLKDLDRLPVIYTALFLFKTATSRGLTVLSVPLYKLRPNSGLSRKIDFAHILHKDRS